MVIFSVIIHNENIVEDVMHVVLKNKYAKTVQLDREVKNYYDKNNELDIEQTTKLSFITKALLYKEIETVLFEKFGEENLIVYAVPVGQMNEKYTSELRNYIKAI